MTLCIGGFHQWSPWKFRIFLNPSPTYMVTQLISTVVHFPTTPSPLLERGGHWMEAPIYGIWEILKGRWKPCIRPYKWDFDQNKIMFLWLSDNQTIQESKLQCSQVIRSAFCPEKIDLISGADLITKQLLEFGIYHHSGLSLNMCSESDQAKPVGPTHINHPLCVADQFGQGWLV